MDKKKYFEEKKEQEREILAKVFSDSALFDSTKECPDFTLCKNGEPIFGVEVTRLFESDAQARIENNENYLRDVLVDGKIRHKEDKKLWIDNIKIENDKTVKAYIHKTLDIDEWIKKIITAIETKIEKSKNYAHRPNIDLIIYDYSCPFVSEQKRNLENVVIPYLIHSELTPYIQKSPFREVYIVKADAISNKKYLPLVYTVTLYNFIQFYSTFDKFYLENTQTVLAKIINREQWTPIEYCKTAFMYLHKIGLTKVKIIKSDNDVPMLAFSNSFLAFINNEIVPYYNHTHMNLGSFDMGDVSIQEKLLSDEFMKFINEFQSANIPYFDCWLEKAK